MPLRAILVEDEAPARDRLRRLLAPYAEVLTVVGDAPDARAGLVLIEESKPDVVFLDIEMPGMTAFEMLRQLPDPPPDQPSTRPRIVFVTAYASYAVRAFEEHALDYLLKPVEPDRLAETIARLSAATAPSPLTDTQLQALTTLLHPPEPLTALPVKTGDRVQFVRLADITHFTAEARYVYLHRRDGQRFLMDTTLTRLAEKLPTSFTQVHRSTIVNRSAIRAVYKLFNGRYQLHLDTTPVVKLKTGPSFAATIQAMLDL